jgi:hypothetical protein
MHLLNFGADSHQVVQNGPASLATAMQHIAARRRAQLISTASTHTERKEHSMNRVMVYLDDVSFQGRQRREDAIV